MSNLPMIPGVPSAQEVNEMKRLMQVMNGSANVPAVHTHQAHYSGGHAGTRAPLKESYSAPYVPSFGTSAEDVAAMKSIMERLNAINGEGEMLTETVSAPATASAFAQEIPGDSFYVTEGLLESNGKHIKAFNVVAGGSNQPVVESLVVLEAAQAVAKFLNKGLTVHNPKIQEVLELEETYNRSRIEAGTVKGRYNRCVELGESEAAAIFKSRHATVRATALSAQDQIKSILASIR